MLYFIYGIRKLNNKEYVYVGKTKNNVEERFRKHLQQAKEKKHDNKLLEEFLNNNFSVVDVLYISDNQEDIDKAERVFIRSFNNLFNIQYNK